MALRANGTNAETRGRSSCEGTCCASSSGLKSRLRWTAYLHGLFLNAVIQLGGASKATPKAILQIMDQEGITIDHVKSHLQKYRRELEVQVILNEEMAPQLVDPVIDITSLCELTLGRPEVNVQIKPSREEMKAELMRNIQAHADSLEIDAQIRQNIQAHVETCWEIRIDGQSRYIEFLDERAHNVPAD